jgi:hypothetical protein
MYERDQRLALDIGALPQSAELVKSGHMHDLWEVASKVV